MQHLFFIDGLLDENQIVVSGKEAHHAMNVLRIGVGEEVYLSDGQGKWCLGEVLSVSKNKFEVRAKSRGVQTLASPKLKVLQALPKSDRLKEAIELMVEAGVAEIIPWRAERSISKWQADSPEKWQSAAVAAAKQAKQFIIPKIADSVDLTQFLSRKIGSSSLIVFHESADVNLTSNFSNGIPKAEEIILVIGPEGGISEGEIEEFKKNGATITQMGSVIFRSAHAGGFALAAISTLLGRW